MVMTLPVNKLKYLVCLRADRQRRHVIPFHLRNKNRGDKAAFFLRFYSTFYTLILAFTGNIVYNMSQCVFLLFIDYAGIAERQMC